MVKSSANKEKVYDALGDHWEVLGEAAIQTILRREGNGGGYNLLKKMTRGEPFGEGDIYQFACRLCAEGKISEKVRDEITALTPLDLYRPRVRNLQTIAFNPAPEAGFFIFGKVRNRFKNESRSRQ